MWCHTESVHYTENVVSHRLYCYTNYRLYEYACIHASEYVCVCLYMFVCVGMCVWVYVCIFMLTYMCVCVSVCLHIWVCASIYILIHFYGYKSDRITQFFSSSTTRGRTCQEMNKQMRAPTDPFTPTQSPTYTHKDKSRGITASVELNLWHSQS